MSVASRAADSTLAGATLWSDRISALLELLQDAAVVLMLVVVVVGSSLADPRFLTVGNLTNVAVNASIIAVIGFGMTIAIAMRGFDLSVGSVQVLTAAVAASVAGPYGVVPAVLAALAVGGLVGLVNGVVISKLQVPAFVATLGMMSVARGIALLYTDGQSIFVRDPSFGYINSVRIVGIPMPLIIALGMLALTYVLLQHTPFGRHVCAVGGNERAALAAGLSVTRLTLAVFTIVGLTAGVSGVMLASQLMVIDGTLGAGLELEVIAIAVLGGTSLFGGRGNLPGTFLAALLLATIRSSLNILNVAAFYQYLAIGVLLLLALSLDTLRRRLLAKLAR